MHYTAAADALPSQWVHWAKLPYPILIRGERGTGKSRLAEKLHQASGSTGAFVARSLAEIPDALAVSELIGHRRGAFTSAINDHEGVLARAHRGTAFLDELGSAGIEAQGALLSFLDHGRVRPIGAVRDTVSNARLIAATNADLEALVAKGSFLPDLVDRFGYYVIWLVPLRARRDDILPLVHRLLRTACGLLGRIRSPMLTEDLTRVLVHAPWPGNVRDVVKVCEYLAGNAGEQADVIDLPPGFFPGRESVARIEGETQAARARRVLAECGGVKTLAARRLGLSRGHLYRLLNTAVVDTPPYSP